MAAARVPVRAGDGRQDYEVFVGPGLLGSLPQLLRAHAPAHRYALITDSTVAELHGTRLHGELVAGGVRCDLLVFPAGESNKTRGSWSELTDGLLRAGVGRDGAVLALGGGVTGDLAGFVAASYLRGIPVVQLPTSIVAMVDSSVGGKTGVDVPAGKNLVGAFHPPRLVVADTSTVATLPRTERAQGLVEAVKHGAIVDLAYLDRLEADLESLLDGAPPATTDAVVRSVEIKAHVVSEDEREAGLREVLNFGHTLGHALEAAADYRLPHGSAVAVGMVLEARLGETLGITRAGAAERLAAVARRLGLSLAPPPDLDHDAVIGFVRADKKARHGRARYVLLEELGRVAREQGRWSREVPEEAVADVLRGWDDGG
ncbi:MAG: 3-dehydroquinate synthase [Gemmatimonadetes bacterium]|nr:3-dehydroquinate synthase [Gemmatimonadota bacterium]